jgi:hypothetical protein
VNANEIRWREPIYGDDCWNHAFKVDDRVRIARIADKTTTRALIGHFGVITDIDAVSPNSVEMLCSTCHSFHTMHEQELDFYGDDLVRLLEEKAGIKPEEPVVDKEKDRLENFLALLMHEAGFERICIKDIPAPAGDPRYSRPAWSKYSYGLIGAYAPFRGYHKALIKLADEAGGYLVEWACYSHKRGYNSVITEDDLDTMTIEMPIRALIVAKP